jgi:hypothetical protein
VRLALPVVAVLSLVLPPSLVAVPKGGSGKDGALSHKYLLDDADFVAVLNVRQVLDSPLFKKAIAGKLDELLRDPKVAASLKDFGLDPMKDIDRICLAVGQSGRRQDRPWSGAFFVVQGRFDKARLETAAKKLATSTAEHGSATIYELTPGGFLQPFFGAVLDNRHVVLATAKEQVQAALDKAAGKRKTELKNKALAAMLAKIKPEESLSAVATGEMVTGYSATTTVKNGKAVSETREFTLAGSNGIEALTVVCSIKDAIHVNATMKATDLDKAKAIEKFLTDAAPAAAARVEKQFPQLAKALKSLKALRQERTITVNAHGSGEAAREFVVGWFTLDRAHPADNKPEPTRRGRPER